MILPALVEYYNRKKVELDTSAPPYGWEWKEISFVVVLNDDGTFLRIDDMREPDGKRKRGKQFLVPRAVGRQSNISANLLWDNPQYVFGIGRKGDEKKAAFLKRMKESLSGIPAVEKVVKYVENATVDDFLSLPDGKEILENNQSNNISFRLVTDMNIVCNRDDVKVAIDSIPSTGSASSGVCMVTGETTEIVNLHHSIKGVKGESSQPSGGMIVSFNTDSFNSYGKEQGMNAPVGAKAEFAYTTALNMLLSDPKHHIKVGDVTFVFWSAKKSSFEMGFASFFEDPPKDNPAMGVQKIKDLLGSLETGMYTDREWNIPFYLLGLSPNSSRISIRLWKADSISGFAQNIKQYFEDFDIVKPKSEPEYYSIRKILKNLSVQNRNEKDNDKNIIPGLATEMMDSAITGSPFPLSMLEMTLRRIKSDVEGRVKPVRASVVKACLNRYYRLFYGKAEEVKKMLDISQNSKGYQLGRLFSVLEKIQEEATPTVNSTIRERYFTSASTTPLVVFPTLLRLKNFHLAKLENDGRKIQFEQMLGEIVDRLNGFPTQLDMYEQGMFAIGYYHQRQYFFTKKGVPASSAMDNKGVEKNGK